MSKTTQQDSIDLIAEIAKRTEGVGPSKAFALAEFLDGNWGKFLKANAETFSKLKKANGKKVITDKQIEDILARIQEFVDYTDVRTAWIYSIGKDFLTSQIRSLQAVTLSNLDINPLLMKVLDLKTPRDVLEFNLYQTVTRSIVTSWGTTVESLLVRCGAERFEGKNKGRAGRRPDIQKQKGKQKYFIQVKSGPNTMNVDMVNSLNEVIAEYKKNEPNASFLLGMTYGRKSRISSQIKDNLSDFENSFLIGRELWDFVSEERNFHRELFKVLDQSSELVTSKTFSAHLDAQLKALLADWKNAYGDKALNDVFENYL